MEQDVRYVVLDIGVSLILLVKAAKNVNAVEISILQMTKVVIRSLENAESVYSIQRETIVNAVPIIIMEIRLYRKIVQNVPVINVDQNTVTIKRQHASVNRI